MHPCILHIKETELFWLEQSCENFVLWLSKNKAFHHLRNLCEISVISRRICARNLQHVISLPKMCSVNISTLAGGFVLYVFHWESWCHKISLVLDRNRGKEYLYEICTHMMWTKKRVCIMLLSFVKILHVLFSYFTLLNHFRLIILIIKNKILKIIN